MVTVRRLDQHPHVLLVTGEEILHDTYRDDLKRELLDREDSPVRRGTHNFWITWFTPTTAGGEFDSGDLSTRPVRFRGVVRMGAVPADTSTGSVQRQLRTMFEEVGHHWLVPGDLSFRSGEELLGLAGSTAWTRHVNDGAPLEGLPLLGRDEGGHWNSFLQADKSPLDGQWWTDERRDGRLTAWTNRALDGPSLRPAGLPEVQLTTQFSDLDLAIIGKIARSRAYESEQNRAQWIDPQYVSPLPYHSGVCVCFSRGKLIQFGYDQDHRTLGVYRSGALGGAVVRQVRPARFPESPFGVALRVLRRGDQYHFQARADNAAGAHLFPEPRDVAGGLATQPRIRGLFDQLDPVPPVAANSDLATWVTVATVTERDAPQAIGVIVDKWDHPSFVRSAFFNLEVRAAGRDTVHAFTRTPVLLPAGSSYDRVPEEPRLDRPAADVDVRVSGRAVLVITAPYAVVRADGRSENLKHFGHSSDEDRAPKVLVKAPTGDFTFGTSALVVRTLTTPWAAGYLRDKDVWGRERSVLVKDAVFSPDIRSRLLPRDRVSTLRCAFILAATDAGAITDEMAERVDTFRRYWDVALPLASRNLLRSRSSL